jgi:hypothetical protein
MTVGSGVPVGIGVGEGSTVGEDMAVARIGRDSCEVRAVEPVVVLDAQAAAVSKTGTMIRRFIQNSDE